MKSDSLLLIPPQRNTETKRHEESKIRLLWMPHVSNCFQLCSFNMFYYYFYYYYHYFFSFIQQLHLSTCRVDGVGEKFWTKPSLRWEGPHHAHKPICGAVFWNLHIIWFIWSCWPLRAHEKIWSSVRCRQILFSQTPSISFCLSLSIHFWVKKRLISVVALLALARLHFQSFQRMNKYCTHIQKYI